jgi:hypothetical protein
MWMRLAAEIDQAQSSVLHGGGLLRSHSSLEILVGWLSHQKNQKYSVVDPKS